ncbi:MAG: DegT/DnrJ/EryC1/StrS family aminotransferase, partial [Hyphomicrobiales bacterium]
EFGFSIIEDASHAIGATYGDRPVGCCQFSDIAIYSFHPVKIITTGEGGIALTNNPKLDQKMRLSRSHGITRDPKQMSFIPDGPWYYEQISLGFNYRLTDIQAAIGISQLKRIDSYIQKRRKIVEVYNRAFKNLPLILPSELSYCQSSWHLYIIRLKLDEIQKTLKEVHEEL